MGEKIWYFISIIIVIIVGSKLDVGSESIIIACIGISTMTLLDNLNRGK